MDIGNPRTRGDTMNRRTLLPFFAMLLAAPAMAASSSANYSNTASIFAAAGGSSASTNYSQAASLGSPASSSAGGPYLAKSGFIGPLYEIQNLHIYPVAPGNIPELGTLQLASFLVLDDSTSFAVDPNSVSWSIELGPITSISASGLMKADAVDADTLAQIRADYDGRFALTQTTVINAIPGTYPGDALPDDWQNLYFGPDNPLAAPDADPTGTGQNNYFKYIAGLDPTDPASRFVVNVDPEPPAPGSLEIQIQPIVPGRTYTLFSASQLSPPNWMPVVPTNVENNGAARTFTQTASRSPSRSRRHNSNSHFLPQHRHPAVHGFALGRKGSGRGVAAVFDDFHPEFLQGFEGEAVLLVEVAGDHHQAVVIQLREAFVEDLLPQLAPVPVVLMAHEEQVEVVAQFFVSPNLRGVFQKELRRQMREFLPSLQHLPNANVRPHHLHAATAREIPTHVNQRFRFVAGPAGEIQNLEIPRLLRQFSTNRLPQQLAKLPQVGRDGVGRIRFHQNFISSPNTCLAAWATSLSPRPERLTRMI